MNTKYLSIIITLLIVSTAFTSVNAEEGKDLYMAKGCTSYHGVAGISQAPIWPNIAGQHKQYLVAQIKDIKNGKRNNGMSITMQGIVAGLSDEEIEKISDWLSKLK